MENKTSQISCIDKLPTVSGSSNIDFDIVLPEYYDTVSKILDCNLFPVSESVNVSGDKISISGVCIVKIVYVGEDKNLYSYKNEQKYTKVIQAGSLTAETCVSVDQSVATLNFRALGPKRISVKGNILITANSSYLKQFDLISDVESESIEVKKSEISACFPCASAIRDFTINTDTVIDDVSEQISEIIKAEASLQYLEIKPIRNKLYINGNCFISLLCLTENQRLQKINKIIIPFSEIIDINGLEENCQFVLKSKINEIKVAIKDSAVSNEVNVNINVEIEASAYVNRMIEYISDIYSTEMEVNPEYKEIEIIKNIELVNETVSFSFESESLSGNERIEILDCWMDAISATFSVTEDKNPEFILNGNLKMLTKTSDGEINSIIRNISRSFNLNKVNDADNLKINSLKMLSVSALQMVSNKIKVSVDIATEIVKQNSCKVKVLSDYKVENIASSNRVNGVILYFASQGESIWDVAKKNKTSVEKIKTNNGVSDDILGENMMLILPNI